MSRFLSTRLRRSLFFFTSARQLFLFSLIPRHSTVDCVSRMSCPGRIICPAQPLVTAINNPTTRPQKILSFPFFHSENLTHFF